MAEENLDETGDVGAGSGGTPGASSILDDGGSGAKPNDPGDTSAGSGEGVGSGDGDSGTGSSSGNAFPEDWREQLAGGDPKKLARLGRYSSPDKFSEGFFNAQAQLSEGRANEPLPENATPEQLAEFRANNGIPESADKYELSLEDGLSLSDDDKAILAPILEAAHSAHATPAQVSAMSNAFFKGREAEMAAIAAQDQTHIDEIREDLREEWGSDFRTNMAVLQEFQSTMPEGIRELVAGARMADGRGLFNSPDFVKWAVDTRRQINPSATVVPNVVDPAQSITAELTSIRETMRTDRAAYDRNEQMQERYRQLIDAQSKLG